MRHFNRVIGFFVIAIIFSFAATASAAEKTQFRVAWSIYVGWMPWDYMAKNGILKKWADKYGIQIDVVQINDYIESINQYTAGKFDACTMASMDALTIPAAGGVDSTVLIAGDYSNGNDGIVLKGKGKRLADIKGQKVNLVELSVSHYLLARALDTVKLKERDITVVNTSDADIVSAFQAATTTSVVTWNPQLSVLKAMPDTTMVFDSSKIPGEIVDALVVNSKTLEDNPKFAKAVVGAWFETMALMEKNDTSGKNARTFMAKASGTDLTGFDSQLKTTKMFYKPVDALAFVRGSDLSRSMDYVRKFSFDHGLLGAGAKSVDAVGISLPGNKTLGDAKNIKLRFDDRYLAMAADGKL